MHNINLIIRNYKLIFFVLLGITGVMGYFASKLQTNATPYFLDKSHPGRKADQHLKEVFTASGEILIISTETKKNTIFNKDSLNNIYEFTLALEKLTLTNNEDVIKFREFSNKIGSSLEIGVFQPSNYMDIQKTYEILKNKNMLTKEDEIFFEDLMVRVWPIKKVRGLVRIESITAKDSESFDIHSLMPYTLTQNNKIKDLEEEALNNMLLKDILFNKLNKKVVNTLVELRIPQDDAPNMKRVYDSVITITENLQGEDKFYIAGPPAIFAQTSAVVKETSDKMFPFVILIVMLMLYLLFKSKRTVFFPILVAIFSVIWTLGTMVLFGYKQNIISTMIPVFLISIGVSDSIHFLSEYHKEKIESQEVRIKLVLKKVFKPMLFTSLTTMIGFLALTYTPIQVLKEFGIFVAIGIIYAFIITITLIPSMQLIFNIRKKKEENTFLYNIGNFLEKKVIKLIEVKSKFIWSGVLFLILFSSVGIYKLQVDNEMIEYFSKDTRVYKDTKHINKHFGGASTVEFTLINSKNGFFKEKNNIVKLEQIISEIKKIPNVGAIYALPNFIKLMNKGLHEDQNKYFKLPDNPLAYSQYLFLYENSNGNEIFNVVNHNYNETRIIIFVKSDKTSIMDNIIVESTKYIEETLPDVKIIPSGFGETLVSTRDEVIYGQINSLFISFIAIFIFLIFLFKDIRVALLGMVPLGLTVLINFGLMGWLGFYLDVGTAIVAAIAIGIGVDNAIYFISYYNEAIGNSREKSISAVQTVFNALYGNSLVLGMGFLVLILADHTALINLGWLVSLTVILSALITLIVLPLLFKTFDKKQIQQKES
jgi:predicted RND superfamily exporter protein